MQLFYTTSAGYDETQYEPSKSTGGYKSSIPVKNDSENNLFGEISCYTVNQNRAEYIAIMLVNTTGAEATNVQLWVVPPEDPDVAYSELDFAIVDTTLDSDGYPYMERTVDRYSKPFNGEFETGTELVPIDIGTMAIDENKGIWIRRTLLTSAINDDHTSLYEIDPDNPNIYKSVELSQSDSFDIKIKYNE